MTTSELIETETLSKGGCTYSVYMARNIIPGESLFSLSLHKELEEIIPVAEFNANSVKMFILKNSEVLHHSDIAMGTWVNGDEVYLDVSTLFSKHTTTLEELKAKVSDQLAAWDIELNEEIKL